MNKIKWALVFLFFGHGAAAQISDKIEKAAKDPATQQRSEKADALLIDKKRIMPEKDSSGHLQSPATGNKKRCTKIRN